MTRRKGHFHRHIIPRWLAMLLIAAIALSPIAPSMARENSQPQMNGKTMSGDMSVKSSSMASMDCMLDGKNKKAGDPCDCCPNGMQKGNCVGACLLQGAQLTAHLPNSDLWFSPRLYSFGILTEPSDLIPLLTAPPRRPPRSA